MRAKRAGAQGYLLKPFNRPQLLDRFRASAERGLTENLNDFNGLKSKRPGKAGSSALHILQGAQALSRMSSGSRST